MLDGPAGWWCTCQRLCFPEDHCDFAAERCHDAASLNANTASANNEQFLWLLWQRKELISGDAVLRARDVKLAGLTAAGQHNAGSLQGVHKLACKGWHVCVLS